MCSTSHPYAVWEATGTGQVLEAGKVHLECFTAEAQAEKRRQIMEAAQ